MDHALSQTYLASILRGFRMYKELAEKAVAQVPNDADLNRQIDPESNSIAVIMKHVGGNLRSRFRDFLTTDGEKPDRNRDGEFEIEGQVSRDQMLRWWNDGFSTALASIEALKPEDLARTVQIRKENLLVVEALNRAVMHIAYHAGQIVYVARHLTGADFQSLSIPKGRSRETGVGTYKSLGASKT